MDRSFVNAKSQSVTQRNDAIEKLDQWQYQVNQARILIAIGDEALDATIQ